MEKYSGFKRKPSPGAPDFTPSSPPSLSVLHFTGIYNLPNVTWKGKKWKNDFHTWELNSTPPAQKSLLHWKQNKLNMVMPRSTCFHSEASWFILTGSTVPFEISTTLTSGAFFGKLHSAVCDFRTFISTAICESSRSPFSRLQEKYWIKFQEFESRPSSKGQRISSKTAPKPERVVRNKIVLSFVDKMNVIFVTSYDNWVWASS